MGKLCDLEDMIGFRGGAEGASRARVRCAWTKFRELSPILTQEEPVQLGCLVCHDLLQRDSGYGGGGNAASGEDGEDDDPVAVWRNSAGQENK